MTSITELAKQAGIAHANRHHPQVTEYATSAESIERFAAAIKAAHIAELAGVEMPRAIAWQHKNGHMQGNFAELSKRHADEYSTHRDWISLYTIDQLQTAVAAAVLKAVAAEREACARHVRYESWCCSKHLAEQLLARGECTHWMPLPPAPIGEKQ